MVYPKLNPTVSREPSPTQKYERINFGDVGFIRHGKFHLLFSAGCPLGERKLGIEVPPTFEELEIEFPVFRQPRGPCCLSTNTVREFGADLSASVAVTPYVLFVGSSPFQFLKHLPGFLNLVFVSPTSSPGNVARHW